MKQRDEKGKFVSEIKDDAENFFSLCIVIYRLLPLLFILFIVYKYYDFSNVFTGLSEIIACGKNCRCCCNGNNFNNVKDEI